MSVPLLHRFSPAHPQPPSSTQPHIRWCPNCEQHALRYQQTRGDRAYWRCRTCWYEVNFPRASRPPDQTSFLVCKIAFGLGLMIVLLNSANAWEAKLRSQQSININHPLPSFKDLR